MIGEIDPHTEIVILSYILQHPQYLKFTGKKLFKYKVLNDLLAMIINFFNEYSEVPSEQQLRNAIIMKKEGNIDISVNEAISQIYSEDPEDDEWLKSVTEGYIQMVSLKKNMEKAVDFYSTTEISLQNANEVVNKCIDIIDNTRSISFDGDFGTNFFDENTHKPRTARTVPYTFEKVSTQINDLEFGTLTSYLGKTNIGKSVFLCNDAAFYIKKGYNVVFISCEMSEQSVEKRIARNLFNMTGDEYSLLVSTKSGVANELSKLRASTLGKIGQLYIKQYPTGSCTTVDIDNYIRNIEEKFGFKVHVLIVDYLGIMGNFRNINSSDSFTNLKFISQDLRALAIKRELVCITACQTNRGSYEINDDLDLKHLSESMAIGYTADNIFGIIQSDQMKEDNKYKLKIVKVRDGEKTGVYTGINVDYSRMRLEEE